MKISQIIQETSTTAGSVAPVEHGFVKMQSRNPSVYGGNKVGNLLKGKKTSKPFANSLNEAAMKDLAYDLQTMKPAEFQKKYGKSREEMKASMSKQPQKPTPPVNETELSEQDLIVVPGQGRLKKSGFVKHDPDKAEHEGETLKNSLHTIVRVASHLDKELSVRANFPEWVSEKIGAVKSDMVSVMDYIISAKEMQGVTENNQRGDSLVTDALKIMRGSDYQIDPVRAIKTVLGEREYNSRRGFYNFYVKQLRDMYDQEGLAEGSRNAYLKHNNLVDIEKPLAGLKSEFEKFLQTHDPKEKQKYQQGIKQRIKSEPMSGPKGVLPEQGVAKGYDPVESDYQQWEDILVKDGYRGDPSGAYALELVVGHQLMSDPAEVASTIRNILTYVKQNRQVLGKAVSDRTTVKDAIIDIKNKFPQQYQAAQQPQGMREGKRNLKCVCKTHGTMQCPVHTPKDIEVIEGAKVDRMVKHVAQSEKKLGHSKKEAENIAWATANKRGMLDNKNKKA